MRYSTELIFIKYVKGLGFLSFGRKFGDKFFKKSMDTATKTGIDAAKTTSKRIVQKLQELHQKSKSKEKEKPEEIYILPEKKNKLLMILNFFEYL